MKKFSKEPGKAVDKVETRPPEIDQKESGRISERSKGLIKSVGNSIVYAGKTMWNTQKLVAFWVNQGFTKAKGGSKAPNSHKIRGIKGKLLNKFVKNAKSSDIEKIDRKLPLMNRGPIREIWTKVKALYKMIKDPDAAWTSRALAIGTLIYLISPLDAIPDVFPLVGLTDDAGLIVTTVAILAHELKKYIKETAEVRAEIEVKRHSRKIRITLIALILATTLTMILKFNLLFYFRFILLGFTLYELMGLLGNLLKNKKQFDKLPEFLKKYLFGQGVHILTKKLKDNRYDIAINGALLAMLIALNVIVFVWT